ncbi:hypothetical protein CHO01_37870 [Cellulomonas hominis]|uniref:Peptidase M16 N-terminal domain-containing protein n=1 Tax=Cellulomonas hominis TaxID=156981 RepID=A0A511FHG9_9CELL|nr:hypothetical protein CHO01_37870 [Cellulomonas hominis]
MVVGVGTSQLDVRSAGMHHLVEHLVMRRLGDLPFEANATSGTECIVFHATGTRSQVLGFLRAVAAAIRSVHRGPSQGALAREQWVLLAEQARRPVGIVGPWTARFGCSGPGLSELPEIGASRATVGDVRAFTSRWFVAQNSRVVLSFDPDGDELGVELPDDPSFSRPAWRAGARARRSAFCQTETPALTLSFEVEQAPGDALVFQVLTGALMRDLRHENALIYSVEATMCATGRGRRVLLATLDPLWEYTDPAVDRALAVLDELATTGPAERALADARTLVLARLRDPADLFDRFLGEVGDALRGEDRIGVEHTRAAVEQMTPDTVRDRLRELLDSLVLTVPEGVELEEGTMHRLAAAGLRRRDVVTTLRRPASEIRQDLLADAPRSSGLRPTPRRPVRGYYPRVFGPVRGEQLWIGPGQFTLIPQDGPAVQVTAAEVVLAETDPDGTVALLTRRGGRIAVNPRHFRGAARWWKHFWDHLDPHVLDLPDPASGEQEVPPADATETTCASINPSSPTASSTSSGRGDVADPTTPRPLGTGDAVALVARARELLGPASMTAYLGVPEVVHDSVATFARLHPDDSPQGPVPGHRHLCFGRDHGGPPEGELLFWVNISGDVAEIELIWYTDDPPATWPAAGDLWIAGDGLREWRGME